MSSLEHRQNPITTGNDTLDRFLGGGFLYSSLNLFERQGPSSRLLDSVWNKSLASSTLASKNNLLYINFNTSRNLQKVELLSSLPLPRKVKSEILYKDIRGKSADEKIKIAWRYSNLNSSPSDGPVRVDQIDFGLSLVKELDAADLGEVFIINVDKSFSTKDLLCQIDRESARLTTRDEMVNIIIKDLLHPSSPLIDQKQRLLSFLYAMRCHARTMNRGAILVSYDCNMCEDHPNIKYHLYNTADCVVSFYSYETGQNKLTGYKNTDGTLEYLKVPKINTFGLHFQRELSDWGYRLTRNHRFFVVDELSLPPCNDDEDNDTVTRKHRTAEIVKITNTRKPLEQVGPLEDFKQLAENILPKKL